MGGGGVGRRSLKGGAREPCVSLIKPPHHRCVKEKKKRKKEKKEKRKKRWGREGRGDHTI
jgi:hypothetical protein